MKKLITILLTITLIGTLFVGCSKKDKVEQPDKSNDNVSIENTESENTEKEKVEEINYVLYLKQKAMPFIFAEKYTIKADDSRLKDKNIEWIALEHLINFNGFEDFISPVPEGTKLLGLTKENGVVYVDLSKEFIDNMPNDEQSTKLAIDSIVNTLTFFDGNESVMFKIEGQAISEINGVDLSKQFYFSSDFFPDK
ncbi:GerMN domain-containing protein [Caloranaerobacter ferrireducens]|uniref:GerMN domain-containing protein n=1 Tax=Caloranaerobacter ferrireducens TaxID=1323370 RepID=UPI00084DCF64|nr:GerMN domain-containing protein [Caloranaerobacter ferrireducens]